MLIKKSKYKKFKENMEKEMGEEVYITNNTPEELDNVIMYEEDYVDVNYWIKNKYWISATLKINKDRSFYGEGHTHVGSYDIACNSFSNEYSKFNNINLYNKLCKKYYEIEIVDLKWSRKDELFKNIIKFLK